MPNELGKWGETLAKTYLEEKDYSIEAVNWRFGRVELDLIAWDGDTLVFVEVKTRSPNWFSSPKDAVTRKKQARMVMAASAFMDSVGHPGEIRFDIISIVRKKNGETKLTHYPDAFFPGL